MKSGGFFAIDHQVWGNVISLGMNAALAYLVLARGSGGDQRTTSWSTNAIEQRTAIGRPKIKIALAKLKDAGLVVEQKGGTRPRYHLAAAPDLPSMGPVLTEAEKRFLATLRVQRYVPKTQKYGSAWGTTQPFALAERLVEKGLIVPDGAQCFRVAELEPPSEKPDWVWLPNELVDGAAGEAAPIELVRQSSCLPAMRLLVDLYHVQSLQHASGVPFPMLRQKYERYEIGRVAQYVIWGFERGNKWATGHPLPAPYMTGQQEKRADNGELQDVGWRIFWNALEVVEDIGLVEFVGHLVTSGTDEGEVIHPYGIGTGEAAERQIARAAHRAAESMLADWQKPKIESTYWLAPVPRHIREVALVGIARMKYRPKTTATASWFDEQSWNEWVERYTAMQHQGNIKGRSRVNQGEINDT